MTKRLWLIGFAVALSFGSTAFAADHPIPGKIALVKYAKLGKFIAKSTTGFPLPLAGGPEDPPTLNGAMIRFGDTAEPGDLTAGMSLLGPFAWKALGNPPGSKGYKYNDGPCKFLITAKVIKGKCSGPILSVTQAFPPVDGALSVELAIPVLSAFDTPAIQYCAAFGGTVLKSDIVTFKAKDAPAPGSCPP